jgi:hypothetical protein
MRILHEEIQQHIHDDICSEVNQAIIAIKIHHRDLSVQSAEQQAKIIEARKRIPEPQWSEIIDLLERVHLEMIQCRQPFRKY